MTNISDKLYSSSQHRFDKTLHNQLYDQLGVLLDCQLYGELRWVLYRQISNLKRDD